MFKLFALLGLGLDDLRQLSAGGVDEGGDGSEQGFLELNPQQLATANEFLANFEGKNLSDLHQINAALQGAMTTVPEDERIILEYVLQKLNVYIAELENN